MLCAERLNGEELATGGKGFGEAGQRNRGAVGEVREGGRPLVELHWEGQEDHGGGTRTMQAGSQMASEPA